MDYGDILLLTKSKDLSTEQRKELMDLSTPNYILYDDQRHVIDEATFLTKYIIPLLPSVEKRDNVDVNDILFDISLDFEKIDFVREPHENGRRIINYDDTIKKYHGRKIILPEIK
jgi:thymidine kinase